MLFEILAAAVVAFMTAYALVAWMKYWRLWRIFNKICGPKCLPLIGDVNFLKHEGSRVFNLVEEYCRRYKETGMMRVWIGKTCVVYVFAVRTVEELLNSSKHTDKGFCYDFLKPWLGDGLLISSGANWYKSRKMITPTFHFKILEEFMHVFNEQATILVGHLDKMADGPAFDIQPFMHHCMLDVICETAMGIDVHAQDDPKSPYVQAVYRSSELFLERLQKPWLWSDFVFDLSPVGRESARCIGTLHGFTKKVIADHKDNLRADCNKSADRPNTDTSTSEVDESSGLRRKRRRLAFLDMLLDETKNDPNFTDEDLRAQVDTFMFAGHDTTARGSVWILYMLGCYPKEQRKVQQEIDSVLGVQRDLTDREVTMDDINQLKYADCFIKETLRLYPPVPVFARSTSESCKIGGFDIPAGSMVSVLTTALHRDHKFFPDPEKFDPDRWLDDNMASRHPFCYLPFSAGNRNCIGQRFAILELKTVMCHILREYNIVCSVKREDIVATAFLVLKPLKPVPIQLIKRRR